MSLLLRGGWTYDSAPVEVEERRTRFYRFCAGRVVDIKLQRLALDLLEGEGVHDMGNIYCCHCVRKLGDNAGASLLDVLVNSQKILFIHPL